jgi:Tfp pilus assembly protein PilF
VLEQNVRLYNRADVRRRFYWWNNAGVQVYDDSKVIYPQRFSASHGFTDVDTWPVDRSGMDLSVIGKQLRGSVSRFAHATREPFMGIWHPSTNAGVVHFAYWSELPGKKLFTWGSQPSGKEWAKVLSDNNSTYAEVQAGPFRNQETYAFMPPQETMQFREYWMPVRDIGGFSRANLDAVVNMQRSAGAGGNVSLDIGLNVNQATRGTARVKNGAKVLLEEKVSLTPRDTWRKKLDNLAAEPKYTFELVSADGRSLMLHTEEQYDFDPVEDVKTGQQQGKRYPAMDQRGEGDFAEVGADEEVNGRLLGAMETFQQGLKRFPESFELNKSVGRLAVILNRFDEAVAPLEKARSLITTDAEVYYYLGMAYDALGQTRKARGGFERALAFRAFRTPSLLALARIDSRSGNLGAALRQVREAGQESPEAARAGAFEVALLRRMKQLEPAKTRVEHWLAKDPTSFQLRYERVKLGGSDEALWKHLAADPERVLVAAGDYMELGFWDDAAGLLGRQYPKVDPATAEPGALLPQDHPMVAYYRAYANEKSGQPADWAAAGKLSTRWVFPYRAMAITVLRRALEVNAKDAVARLFMGDLYEAYGLPAKAMAEWQAARSIRRDLPTLHRNIALNLMTLEKSPEKAAEIYREGLDADPSNLEIYTGINQALTILGRPASERAAALERYPDKANMPANLTYQLALALAEDNRAAQAEKLFEGRYFPREEGGLDARTVQLEVQLRKALAAKASLGAVADEPLAQNNRFQYWAGVAEAAAGNQEAARKRWQKALESGGRGFDLAYAYKAAQKLGQDGPEWKQRLESALTAPLSRRGSGGDQGRSTGQGAYMRGLILQALGRNDEAQASFRAALTSPDRMLLHYYVRTAMQQ